MIIRRSLRVSQSRIKPSIPCLVASIPVSGQVASLAVNSLTNRVYFLYGDNKLGVLNAQTNTMLTTLRTGQLPTDVVINQRTNRIYVSNFFDGTVSVINGATNRVINTIKVGQRCDNIAVHTRTNLIYVSTISLSSKIAYVVVINGKTNKVQTKIKFIGRPSQLLINETTNRIYVTNTVSDTLSVIDGLNHTILRTVKVGSNPVITPVLDKTTHRLYVANNLSRFTSAVHLRRTFKARHIQLGRRQRDIVLNPITHRIYVSIAQVSGTGRVFAISGKTNRVLAKLTVPTFTSVLINPRTNHLFITDSPESGSSTLFVYHGSSLKLFTKLKLGKGAGSMVLNPRTNRVYVGGENVLSVIQD